MFRVSSPSQTDLVMGAIAILVMLETSRRALGLIISLIAVVFVLQLYFGSYLPGRLSHPGMSVERILEFTYSTQEALFGVVTATFATFVFPFMIRSEEHTSQLQSLMRISYAVFCLQK